MVPNPLQPRATGSAVRAALALLAALALVTCAEDPIGPATGRGHLLIIPVFGPYARVAPLTLDQVRIVVERQDSRTETSDTIVDEVRAFDVDSNQLRIDDISVRMQVASEDLLVSLQLLANGTLLWDGSQLVRVVRGQLTAPTSIPLNNYRGPGANVATLTLAPRDTVLSPGATLDYRLDAFDIQGAPVAQYYVSWSLTGGPATGARINAAGRLTAPSVPDTFYVKVVAPNGVMDSTRAIVGTTTAPSAFTWTGAVSTDWSVAGNWSPAQVPGFLDSVVIGAAGRQPSLSTTTLTGAINIIAGGNLTINGQGLSIVRGLATGGTGVLTMTNETDAVVMGGNAMFDGGSELNLLTAGGMSIAGNLTQLASTSGDSYHPSGTHLTVLAGTAQAVSFATPATSQFQDVAWVGTGTLTLLTPVMAQGTFVVSAATASTITTPNGSRLTVGDLVSVSPLVLNGVPLTLSQSTPGSLSLSNVTFQSMATNVSQLVVSHPGGTFDLSNLVFSTTPVAPNGFYIDVTDNTGPADGTLTINLVNPTPISGGAFIRQTNGAIVNWPSSAARTWIGPSGGDWFTAANWSPAGVPAAAEDVQISGATTVVSLATCPQGATARNLTLQAGSQVTGSCTITVSGNADVQGTIVTAATTLAGTGTTARGFFNGPVTVTGTVGLNGLTIVQGTVTVRGTLTLNGSLLIPNALDVGGGATGGRLVMTNPLDSIRVIGTTTFRGADETGFITAGVLDLRGDFVQAATGGSTGSFVASGTNEALFIVAGQAISFANPGVSHFANLKMRNGAVLNTAATVTGTLIAPRADQGGFSGAGSLTVTGNLNVGTFTLAGVPLTFSPPGTVTPVFDNVTFNGFSAGATQLTVNASGGSFTFNSLRFQTTPTTGFYVSASGPFTLNLAGPTPASGGGFVQQLSGATVVWPAASTLTWTGTADNFWRNADNWSPAFVPNITTDVVIPAGTPFAPTTDVSHAARSLALNTGATLNLGNFNLTVAGNAFADGQITGGGVIISATAQIRGRFPTLTTQAQVTVVGRTVLGGNLSVNNAAGNLIMNGQTATVAGNLVVQAGAIDMTKPLDSLIVTGNATFAGGSTSGLLTQGVLVIQGNFAQQASVSVLSFAPSGTHKTVLGAAAARAVSIGSPGPGATGSHFQVLDVSNATGGLSLDVNMQADSLISNSAAAKLTSPFVQFTARRAQVSGLILDNTRFILDEQGTFSTENFSNVTFTGFPTTSTTMLTVVGPGSSVAARPPVTTTNVAFQSLPVGANNFYVDLTSSNSATFIMTMTGSNQSPQVGGNGPALTRVTPGTGVAIVNWP